ncbi:hypothetical protein EVA_22380 [gut metagenome]|uniref:Uncharacterized protein n=1 Tax=gut metagenome TaxID=749906 RepID=J9F4U1_9ZZZZ
MKLHFTHQFNKMEEWRALQEHSYRMNEKTLKLGQIQNTGFTLIR